MATFEVYVPMRRTYIYVVKARNEAEARRIVDVIGQDLEAVVSDVETPLAEPHQWDVTKIKD